MVCTGVEQGGDSGIPTPFNDGVESSVAVDVG
jgi:hypothetical protein